MKKILLILTVLLIAGCAANPKVADTHQMPDGTTMDHSMHMAKIISEEQFLYEMIPHHEEAVSASVILLAETKNQELAKFLDGVVTVQTAEINQMKSWYKDWFEKDYQANTAYMPMMGDLTKLTDETYISGMIFHHQGAIQMAKDVLQVKGINAETRALAENIIKTQTEEIELLESL